MNNAAWWEIINFCAVLTAWVLSIVCVHHALVEKEIFSCVPDDELNEVKIIVYRHIRLESVWLFLTTYLLVLGSIRLFQPDPPVNLSPTWVVIRWSLIAGWVLVPIAVSVNAIMKINERTQIRQIRRKHGLIPERRRP